MATAPQSSGRLIFQEAIAAFAQRQRLQGTARYDSIRSEEHYRAFAVAGAMKADLLADLREAVRRAIEDGTGIETFREDFWRVVQQHGWNGWTGQGTEAGEAWRTRVIYTTNIRKSHSAGRYAQLTEPAFLAEYPYWQWVHSGLAQEPRTHHLAWDGMTLHHSDPFWRTHFPPRIPPDYGCTCRVKAVRRPAAGAQTQAPAGWQKTADVGAGAPPSFVAESIRYFVEMKGQKLPPPESAALREAVQAYQAARAAQVTAAPAAVVDFASQAKAGDAVQMVIAPVPNAQQLANVVDFALDLVGYAITLDNSGVLHAMRKHSNAKAEASRGQIALTYEDFGLIAAIIAEPDAVFHDGKNLAGRDVLMLDKLIAGIGYRLAVEIRPGRKTLTFLSLRKKPRAWRDKSEE